MAWAPFFAATPGFLGDRPLDSNQGGLSQDAYFVPGSEGRGTLVHIPILRRLTLPKSWEAADCGGFNR